MEHLYLNWLPFIISLIGALIIGTLWYSPTLFGNPWIKSLGFTSMEEAHAKFELHPNKNLSMALNFITQIIACLFMILFINLLIQISECKVVLLILVITIILKDLSVARWEGKNWQYMLINASNTVVTLGFYILINNLLGAAIYYK